jgi:hypothetical protein
MVKPDSLTDNVGGSLSPRTPDRASRADYHVFRDDIKPMWEVVLRRARCRARSRGDQDPHNLHGGRFVVRLRKGMGSRCWEDMARAAPR